MLHFMGLIIVAAAIYFGLDNLGIQLIKEWRKIEKERKFGKDK